MDTGDLLLEAFGRVRDLVPTVVEGLDEDQLASRVQGRSNPIGWLLWHLTRVQDSHVADAAGQEQVWLQDGWHDRFDLDLPVEDTGYGHDSDDVAKVRTTPELLAGYHAAVAARTEQFVRDLGPDDLDRVVDAHWSPPVTLGVRLVSVVADCLQHLGQAAYVRGVLGDQPPAPAGCDAGVRSRS